MAETTNGQAASDSATILDVEHLANQAMRLFSKRYAKAFDTHVDVRRSGIVKKEDYINFCTRQFDDDMIAKAREIATKQWQVMTGGYAEDVQQLSRKQCIDLCLRGYHSTDLQHRQSLKTALVDVANFHFDLIDTDHDGVITPEEWSKWTRMLGNTETWKGAFAVMDINGDGKVERDEWKECFVGFFCYIDEERYSHFFGLIR